MSDVLVICGPKRFHGADALLTEIANTKRGRKLLLESDYSADGRAAVEKLVKIWPGILEGRSRCSIQQAGSKLRWSARHWRPGFGVPRCSMIDPGPAVTVEEAEALGLTWSQECAKALGLVEDPRPPLERVAWKEAVAAYRHAIRCDVCTLDGIASCHVFEKIALGQMPAVVSKPTAKAAA